MLKLIKSLALGSLTEIKHHLNLSPDCIFLTSEFLPRVIGYHSNDILCGGKRGY